MMHATYYDPSRNDPVETELNSAADLEQLTAVVRRVRTQRGTPTIEISKPDTSSLGLSFDDERAFLVWTDSLGDSSHSVGGGYERDLVFDYFGSWSEAPAEYLVPYADGLVAAIQFLHIGTPVTDSMLFSPD